MVVNLDDFLRTGLFGGITTGNSLKDVLGTFQCPSESSQNIFDDKGNVTTIPNDFRQLWYGDYQFKFWNDILMAITIETDDLRSSKFPRFLVKSKIFTEKNKLYLLEEIQGKLKQEDFEFKIIDHGEVQTWEKIHWKAMLLASKVQLHFCKPITENEYTFWHMALYDADRIKKTSSPWAF